MYLFNEIFIKYFFLFVYLLHVPLSCYNPKTAFELLSSEKLYSHTLHFSYSVFLRQITKQVSHTIWTIVVLVVVVEKFVFMWARKILLVKKYWIERADMPCKPLNADRLFNLWSTSIENWLTLCLILRYRKVTWLMIHRRKLSLQRGYNGYSYLLWGCFIITAIMFEVGEFRSNAKKYVAVLFWVIFSAPSLI